ncbi:hypothetical protein I6E31_02200 [Fusobacterium varium]|nr:hypothetical protein [Fusobacterium varium]
MSSRVINTILNLKDEMTQKLQAPLMSVRKLKREYENTKKELERYEDAQTKASQMLEQAKNKMEEVKKEVLNSSQAYQDNVKSLDRLKAKNEEIKVSINRHESELSGLQSSYNENKRAYDNAKNTLVELKRQYDDNSQEVKEQERILQSLEREYNSSKSAYDNAKKSIQALKEEERTNTTTIKTQSKALESLKETLLNNSTAVKLAQRNITRYTQSEKEAGEKAKEARQKISQLSSEVAKNKKKFDDAKKTVKGWRDSAISSIDDVVKKMGQLTAVAVTATGGFALKTGLETAFNLEAYRTQLETATKDTEKTTKLIRKAQELSIATPFTPEEAIQSTAKMEALGVDSEKWLKMVADMAGATNKEMEQATDALIDMLSKQEFEGIKEFGINKEMIMAKANQMFGKNKVFKKSGELRKGKDADMQVVIETIMREKFEGGSDKLSKTVKGVWSTITGATGMALAKIFGMEDGLIKTGSMLDMLRQKLQMVADKLIEWQNDGTLDEIAQKFTETFNKIIETVIAVYNYLKDNKETIASVLKVVGVVYMVAKAMIFLSSVISAVKIVFATLNVLLLNPAFLTIAGIILAVVVVGYILYKCFKLIVGVVKICWDKFKEFGEYMPEWAKLLLLPLAPILAIIKGFKLIIDGAGKAWKWIKGFFSADEEKNVKINEVTEQELLSNDDVEKSVFNNKIDDFDNKKSPFDNINKAEMLKNDVAKVEKNNNVTDVKSQTIVKNIEPQITINVNGDVYGYNDFEEKVAGVFKNIIKYNMQNVT